MDDAQRIAKLLDAAEKAPRPTYCDTDEKYRFEFGYQIGRALESVLGGEHARIGAALLELLRQGRDLSISAAIAFYLRRAPALASADVLRLLEQIDKSQAPWLSVKGARGWHLALQELVDSLTERTALVKGVAGFGQPVRAWLEGALVRRGAIGASELDPETLSRLALAWVTTPKSEVEACFEGLDRIWPEAIWLRAVVDAMLATESRIELGWKHLGAPLGACTDEDLVRCLGRDQLSDGETIFLEHLHQRGASVVPLLEPLCREALVDPGKYMPWRYRVAMAASARLGAEIPREWDEVVETVLHGPSIEQLLRAYPEPRREALLLRRIEAHDEDVWQFVTEYPTPKVVDATLRLSLKSDRPYIKSDVAGVIGRRAPAQVSEFIRTSSADALPWLYNFLGDARSAEIPAAAAVLLRSTFSGLREVGAKILGGQRFRDLTPELMAEMIAGEEPAQGAAVAVLLDNGHDPRARKLAGDLARNATLGTPLLAARLALAAEIEPEIEALLREAAALPPETTERIDALLVSSLSERWSVADAVVAAVKEGVRLPDLFRWFLERREASSSISERTKLEQVTGRCLARGFLERPELPLLTFRFFGRDAVGASPSAWKKLFDARVLDDRQLKMVLPGIAASDPQSVRASIAELATRKGNEELVARCLRDMGASRDELLAQLLAHKSATARATAAGVLVDQPGGTMVEALKAAIADKPGKQLRGKLERALAACVAVEDLDRQPVDRLAPLEVRELPIALQGPVRAVVVRGDLALAASATDLALVRMSALGSLATRSGINPHHLLLAPDGAFYASGANSLEVSLIDGDEVKAAADIPLDDEVWEFLALPGRQMVVMSASGQADGWVKLIDVATGREVGGRAFEGYPNAGAASADGKRLVIADDSGAVGIYATQQVKRLKKLVTADEDTMPETVDVAYFAGGERIVVATLAQNGPTTLRFFDSEQGKLSAEHEGIDEPRLLASLGAPLVVTLGDASLSAWTAAGQRVRRLACQVERGRAAIAGPLVALVFGDELRLWSPERHEWIARHRHTTSIEVVVGAGTDFVFGDTTGRVFRARVPKSTARG